ncbi:MAG TPA: hypothetical protein VGG44_06355, partial [Tepidisphaeraceae bacterium]
AATISYYGRCKRFKPHIQLTDMDVGAPRMAVQIICPNLRCRKILSVPDDVRGKQVKCEHCQTTFRVPEVRRPVIPAGPNRK